MKHKISSLSQELPHWELLKRKVERKLAADVVLMFRTYNIETVLIKGLAAHLNYPKTHFRVSSDIDLALAGADFQIAEQVIKSSHTIGLNIDLHRGLRHLDTVVWDDLFINSRLIDIDGTPVRMLRPEDHFRVLCVHWLNDGGQYRERLWDIYYAVANRPADFDWERCLGVVSERRRRWIVCAVGLAHKYLDLQIDDLPFAGEAKRLPAWLVRTVEREWASDVRLMPMSMYFRQPRGLWAQVKKRIPPNPIQSIIETEGSFDSPIRLHYQIVAGAKRVGPLLRSLRQAFTTKSSG